MAGIPFHDCGTRPTPFGVIAVDQLAVWVRRSPAQHPTSFAIMALTTTAVMLDFTWVASRLASSPVRMDVCSQCCSIASR
jgi:hypothetical protein